MTLDTAERGNIRCEGMRAWKSKARLEDCKHSGNDEVNNAFDKKKN